MNVFDVKHPHLHKLPLKSTDSGARFERDIPKNWPPEFDNLNGSIYFLCFDDEVVKVGKTDQSMKKLYLQYKANWESSDCVSDSRAVISLRIAKHLAAGGEVYYMFYNCEDYIHYDIDGNEMEFQKKINSNVHEVLTVSEVIRCSGVAPLFNFSEGASKQPFMMEFELYRRNKRGVVESTRKWRKENKIDEFISIDHPDRFQYEKYLG